MEDNVWFTYKARIQANLRLTWLDVHSQFLLVWYAFLGACLGIITTRYPKVLGADTDILAAILSVGLLGVSMAVTNRGFSARSIAMRQNYLDLQKLYNQLKQQNGMVTQSEIDRYHILLASVENHKNIDDVLFRVLNARTLNTRNPTQIECIEAYTYLAVRVAVTFTLYAAPLVIWWMT